MARENYDCPKGCCAVRYETPEKKGGAILVNGERYPMIVDLAVALDMSYDTLQHRLRKKVCLSQPVRTIFRGARAQKFRQESEQEQIEGVNKFLRVMTVGRGAE